MTVIERNKSQFPITVLCETLGVNRSTWYNHLAPKTTPEGRTPPRKLAESERAEVLRTLNSETFQNESVPTVYAKLLDKETYLCSQRTMYRILKDQKQTRPRRHEREHPNYHKPQLVATGPNQVWSWDITRLKGPKSWIFYELYVVIDIYSRCIVSWCLSEHESGEQAKALIKAACIREGINKHQLTVHSDRGRAMRSKQLSDLYGELGIIRSLNRPRVSNDNPYSESQFKTLKYRPDYPDRFGSIEDARTHLRAFFEWYNTEHRHSGIAMMPPAEVHAGRSEEIRRKRQTILRKAHQRHPERFVRGIPQAKGVPEKVWINEPVSE